MRDGTTRDGFFGGRLVLRQPVSGHRVGTDAVLLAGATPAGRRIYADLGAGVGAAGLAVLSREPQARGILVEIVPDLAAMAVENAAGNGLAGRSDVVVADLLAPGRVRRAAGLAPGSVDCVLTNPPFREAGGGSTSPDGGRALAHAMPQGGLDKWLRAACDLLAPEGEIVLLHRADALGDLLAAMKGRFGAIAVKPVHPRAEAAASRLLVHGRKGSRAALRLLPGLVLHEADGKLSAEAEALHRGEATIDLC